MKRDGDEEGEELIASGLISRFSLLGQMREQLEGEFSRGGRSRCIQEEGEGRRELDRDVAAFFGKLENRARRRLVVPGVENDVHSDVNIHRGIVVSQLSGGGEASSVDNAEQA